MAAAASNHSVRAMCIDKVECSRGTYHQSLPPFYVNNTSISTTFLDRITRNKEDCWFSASKGSILRQSTAKTKLNIFTFLSNPNILDIKYF